MNVLRSSAAIVAAVLAGCAAGPRYRRPDVPVPPAYKESVAPQGAATGAAVAATEECWWAAFGDPDLDRLVEQADRANPTIAGAEAALRAARGVTRTQRAGFFPTVGVGASATRSNRATATTTAGAVPAVGAGRTTATEYQASATASWEPDLWGRTRRAYQGARASEQASAADLAGARLAVRAQLATDYLDLRSLDLETKLLADTVAAYESAARIARNRYAAGIAARSDVLQAETQLLSARASLEQVRAQRAAAEHAIAALVGEPAGTFAVAPREAPLPPVPAVETGVPSGLLERRPDVAGAERRAAAASAQIGVQQVLYFPAVTLDGSYGFASQATSTLFDPASGARSIVLSVAETLFDFGARRGRVEQARAQFDQAAQEYRATVLAAFRDVEDQLVAVRSQSAQADLERQASAAADQAEQIALNQYRAGQLGFAEVVVAQTAALAARRALVAAELGRATATVALVQAIGGGWSGLGPR